MSVVKEPVRRELAVHPFFNRGGHQHAGRTSGHFWNEGISL